jgi:hypothetical protein
MPIHDWSRVDAGVFHDLHLGWIDGLRAVLNRSLLPEPYYALAEPVLGAAVPDVLTLRASAPATESVPAGLYHDADERPLAAATAVVVQDLPPPNDYLALARHIVIKSSLRNDDVVAVIELFSRANKASTEHRDLFLRKSLDVLRSGIHLAFVDVQPPTSPVPAGFHALICEAHGETPPPLAEDRPLEAAAYQVLEDASIRSHRVALRVGDTLPEVPVFLTSHHYVRLPLEETYRYAFGSLARRFRRALGE